MALSLWLAARRLPGVDWQLHRHSSQFPRLDAYRFTGCLRPGHRPHLLFLPLLLDGRRGFPGQKRRASRGRDWIWNIFWPRRRRCGIVLFPDESERRDMEYHRPVNNRPNHLFDRQIPATGKTVLNSSSRKQRTGRGVAKPLAWTVTNKKPPERVNLCAPHRFQPCHWLRFLH